jgi:hypothetical protein
VNIHVVNIIRALIQQVKATAVWTWRVLEMMPPTLTTERPAEVWTAISRGAISGTEALLSGVYPTIGDLTVLLRCAALFGRDGM